MVLFRRFDKKRVEEELEAARRKHSRLTSHLDGSSVVEKLKQELKEYKEILKCSVCLDRPKEVHMVATFPYIYSQSTRQKAHSFRAVQLYF